MKKISKRTTLITAIMSIAFAIGGCVKAQKITQVRYDASKDEMRCLVVYCHIYGETASDLNHLENLWRHRAHIIPLRWSPLFGTHSLFNEQGTLILNSREWRDVDLNAPSKATPISVPGFSLDEIQINSSGFFLSEEQTLCSFIQFNLTGKALDGIVQVSTNNLRTTLLEWVSHEMSRRAAGGEIRAIAHEVTN